MEKKEDVAAALALALFLSLSLHPDRALSHATPAPLRRALEGRDLARHDGEGEAQHRAEATGHAALFATQLSSRRSSLRGAALFVTQLSSRRSSLRDAALFSSFRLDVVSSSSSFFGSPLSFPCSTCILSRNKKHRTR